MDLVERYLAAVARQLPKRQREDVVAELRDVLLSKVEEAEGALGRPLDAKETEEILRTFGHPLVVASRYWPIQQLIGPDTFPFYVFFLKMTLLIVLAVQFVGAVVGMAISPDLLRTMHGLLGGLWTSLFAAAAWVTAAFVLIEYLGVQKTLARKWRASQLPAASRPARRRPADLMFEAASTVIFILWWTGVIHFRAPVAPGEPGLRLALSAAWAPFYWPIVAYACAQCAVNLLDLVRPGWVRFSIAANTLVRLSCAGLALLLLRAGPLVTVSGVGEGGPHVANGLQHLLTIGLASVAIGSVVQTAYVLAGLAYTGGRRRGAIS